VGHFVASMMMSVDGFDGNEHFAPTIEDHQVFNDQLARTNGLICDQANHQTLVPYWDDLALDDPNLLPVERQFAELFRARPRYVVADVLEPVDPRATLIRDNPVARLQEIKAGISDDLMVAAGPDLLTTLFDYDLIDELDILVLPFVLGSGARQVGNLARIRHLTLLRTRGLPTGSVALHYQVLP